MNLDDTPERLGPLTEPSAAVLAELAERDAVTRVWAADHTLWRDDPTEIADRLGWLTVVPDMASRLDELEAEVAPLVEDVARDARYAALSAAARRLGAVAVLLGHTRDDQAETVLLRLARGSGSRSLAGMAPVSGIYRRPFLGLSRARTREACAALGLRPWEDPHNSDPAYARVRVRKRVIPVLEEALGPGVVEALARTARLCRDDADALDEWADAVYAKARGPEGELAVDVLESVPAAVRRRVIHRAALAAGVPASALGAVHIEEAERLVTGWHGQKGVVLPGKKRVVRRYGTLYFVDNLA